MRRIVVCACCLTAMDFVPLDDSSYLRAQEKHDATQETAKLSRVGTIESVNGSNLTLRPDSGPGIAVIIQDSTHLMRIAPGERELSNASPVQVRDLQIGDRMLVRGKLRDEDQTFVADMLVVIKRTDITDKRQRERQDWQQRGVGGIVSALNAASGAITISLAPEYSVTIKTSKNTDFLRYAPGSVRFADAKRSAFDDIKMGDQLRARGSRSTDGKEITAEQVISGSFRNIAGLLLAVDSGANTITVSDLLTRKPVVVNISRNSQLRKLTPEMAQMAVTLLRQSAQASSSSTGSSGAGASAGRTSQQAQGNNSATSRSAPPDFSRMLGSVPPGKFGDLQKGDAVMIVSDQAADKASTAVTAVTLVSGVEPILRAVENGNGAAILSRWNISPVVADQ